MSCRSVRRNTFRPSTTNTPKCRHRPHKQEPRTLSRVVEKSEGPGRRSSPLSSGSCVWLGTPYPRMLPRHDVDGSWVFGHPRWCTQTRYGDVLEVRRKIRSDLRPPSYPRGHRRHLSYTSGYPESESGRDPDSRRRKILNESTRTGALYISYDKRRYEFFRKKTYVRKV